MTDLLANVDMTNAVTLVVIGFVCVLIWEVVQQMLRRGRQDDD